MSNRVPGYLWVDPPIFASQDVQETWEFVVTEETRPGSKIYVPLDLTGLTATLSLEHETVVGSGIFVNDIDEEDCTIPTPASGIIQFARTDDIVLNEGDHLGEIALFETGTCVARLPGGRRYFRVIVGRKLGS